MNRHHRRRLAALGLAPILFTDLDALVPFARQRAMIGVYDGCNSTANLSLINHCRHLYAIDPEASARLIYTRDIGHHSGGWWKNPDYERCIHLSISFCVNPTDQPLEFDRSEAQKIAISFFGEDVAKVWIEKPYSEEGKHADVHHYRLFCDPAWQAIMPRDEVYSKEHTPANWQSFSELHGWTPEPDQAPFLLDNQ